MNQNSDLVVIGGGMIGLSTAYQFLKKYPDKKLVLLEKEKDLCKHQSGRNSGVLHSGIYYTPGSRKAAMTLAGKKMMQKFIQQENLPYDLCGKVIVARCEEELPALNQIFQNGKANGVECEIICKQHLLEIEPHCNGIRAIHVPEAGITSYPAVAKRLAEKIAQMGGIVYTETRVTGIHENVAEVVVTTDKGNFVTGKVVGCAGLYSDQVAKMTAAGQLSSQIVPFRGEYYQLKPHAEHFCNGLIYPVPDPRLPFLGVHFTKMLDGGVDCGPNAVLALAREGYSWSKINLRELYGSLAFSGFQRLALKYWRPGLGEIWRSLSKAAFVRALQGLIPEITAKDLQPHPAGVRAQALTPQGELVYDFDFVTSKRVMHVVNAPSPAATASLYFGGYIVEQLS